jgi:hypothetical protein
MVRMGSLDSAIVCVAMARHFSHVRRLDSRAAAIRRLRTVALAQAQESVTWPLGLSELVHII